MTVITSREFRANQSKYIGMAHQGEEVVLTSRMGAVRLTPVSENDKSFDEYVQSEAFLAVANKAREEFKQGNTLKFDSAADAQRWMDEL